MPDGIKHNTSILTRVLNTFKAWVPLNRAENESLVPDRTRTDDVRKINEEGPLGPISLSSNGARTNTSHNRESELDRRDQPTKSNVKPAKSLNTTSSKYAETTDTDKVNEDPTDYSVLLQLLAPKESEKPIIGPESSVTKATSPYNSKESTISKSTSPAKEPTLKRSFQFSENDIKDIADRKKLPSMKKIKISKYSLRILPSDDEMDVDHVYIDTDDDMKDINGGKEPEFGKLTEATIQSGNLGDNDISQEQKEVDSSIEAGTTPHPSHINAPKLFTGGINLLNETPETNTSLDKQETKITHGSIHLPYTDIEQRQSIKDIKLNTRSEMQIKREQFLEKPTPVPISSSPLFVPQDDSDDSDLEEMERVNLEFHNVIASIGQFPYLRVEPPPKTREKE